MKAMKKLIPAVAMLLVSVVTMSTASFAWFSMSRQVTANGMNVTVTAPTNLVIKVQGADNSTYAEVATRTDSGIVLVPASTINGTDYFVVKNGQAVVTNTGALKNTTEMETGVAATKGETETTESSSTTTPGTEGAWYDFVYTIKSDGNQDVSVVVTDVTATLTSASTAASKSATPVRVAVICGSTTNMFNPNRGTHHTSGNAVSGIYTSDEAAVSGGAIKAGTAKKSAVTYTTPATLNDDENVVVTLSSSNNYTADITIRVWYEGEDTECTVTRGTAANFDVVVKLADRASLDAPSAS